MATQLQMRRGTTAQVAAFTGANGEVVVDTEKKTLFVNDGSTAGGLEIARADFSNISASASLTLGTLTATTLNVTTLDLTTLEVTTIKAKDGTAAGSIADSTGVVTIASAVLTTADINAGTFDGVVGGTTPAAGSFTTLAASTSITGTLATAAQANITSVGTLTGFTSTGIDDNASSTAITIDSSQNIGIGVTSPTSNQGWAKFVEIAGGTSNAVVLDGTDGQESVIGSVDSFYIDVCGHSTATNNNIVFRTSNTDSNYSATEKMRIDSDGDTTFSPSGGTVSVEANGFIYAKQALNLATAGARLYGMSNRGILGHLAIEQTATGADGGYITLNTCASGATTSTERVRKDVSGRGTMPYQPAFSVGKDNVQSNISTSAYTTVEFNTEYFDQGDNFDHTTYTFTAPVDGKYQLNTHVRLDNVDYLATYYAVFIQTTNRAYYSIIQPKYSGDPAYSTFNVHVLAEMDASDTAYVRVYQDGGTAETDIDRGVGGNGFSGFLVA